MPAYPERRRQLDDRRRLARRNAATWPQMSGRIAAAWDALADRLAGPRIIEAGGVDVWETG
ncbi:MAG: hypothetical protein R3D59_11310 [Paracoccaceae bacterium]